MIVIQGKPICIDYDAHTLLYNVKYQQNIFTFVDIREAQLFIWIIKQKEKI